MKKTWGNSFNGEAKVEGKITGKELKQGKYVAGSKFNFQRHTVSN